MIKLDGSRFEGGGSIVRTALAFSVLTKKAFEIDNIRQNRPNKGLKNQHLFCIRALEDLYGSVTENAELGSTELKFYPKKSKGKNLEIDIGTAGSISLFLQSVLIPSLFSEGKMKITVIGGTDVKWAAPIDYFSNVFLPHLHKFADIKCKLMGRGYYPKGNGKVEIEIRSKIKREDFDTFELFREELSNKIPKINLIEKGQLIQIKGLSHASNSLQGRDVAIRQAKTGELTLSKLNVPVNIQSQYYLTPSDGSGITLWSIFSKDPEEIDMNNPIRLGSDSLGEINKKAEKVGIDAANSMLDSIKNDSPVDIYLGDQIIPLMALLPGSKMKVPKITGHILANIYVIEEFLGKTFEIDSDTKIITSL